MSPRVQQALRLVRDAGLFPVASLRAKRILRAYRAHYRRARGLPPFLGVTPGFRSPQDVRVHVLRPGEVVNGLRLPDLSTIVRRLRDDVEATLARTANCLLFPKPARGAMPA